MNGSREKNLKKLYWLVMQNLLHSRKSAEHISLSHKIMLVGKHVMRLFTLAGMLE